MGRVSISRGGMRLWECGGGGESTVAGGPRFLPVAVLFGPIDLENVLDGAISRGGMRLWLRASCRSRFCWATDEWGAKMRRLMSGD
jgi:hypothetical protein